MNYKQEKEERLQDYTKRFKVSKEILGSHLDRPINIEKVIANHPDYDEVNEIIIKKLT